MNKRFICFITALALMLTALPVLADEGDGNGGTETYIEYTWDLTTLNADDFNADAYTAVGEEGVLSVKTASANITENGVKTDKNGNSIIQILPPSDGKITVTYTGGNAVMPTQEKRKSGDAVVVSGTATAVSGANTYYLQGTASSAAVISSISFTNKPDEQPEEPVEINVHSNGTWDLTALAEYQNNFADYTAIDDIGVISIKSVAGNISDNGVTVRKVSGGNSGAFIKITPKEDGLLTVTFTGKDAVVMSPKESRSGSDPNIHSEAAYLVKQGTSYWMQGSGDAAVITSIKFETADVSAINAYDSTTGVWNLTGLDGRSYMFGSEYTTVDGIGVMSVKAASESVTFGGIEASNDNNTRIKITPTTNGVVSVTYSDGGLAISKQEEINGSAETALTSEEPFTVRKNRTYYIQGSDSAAALISAVKFEAKEIDEEPIDTYDSENSTWTLTGLSQYEDRFDTQNYTAVDEIKVVSVKADSSSITDDGISVSKNGSVIRIIPEANGKLTVNFTGTGLVIGDGEKRTGNEPELTSGTAVDVLARVPYYVLSSSDTAATVASISFEETKYSLFEITGIGFNEDYTKVVEFDIEKGDDYDHDVTAVICIYDGSNALKKVGIKKITKGSLIIGSNTVKCDIDIAGYNSETDQVKIFLWSKLS